jgi:hypothetical protein
MCGSEWNIVGESAVEAGHELSHLEGGAGGFDAAVMFTAEATDLGLFFIVEQVNAVDDRQTMADLEFDEGMADGVADVPRVAVSPWKMTPKQRIAEKGGWRSRQGRQRRQGFRMRRGHGTLRWHRLHRL